MFISELHDPDVGTFFPLKKKNVYENKKRTEYAMVIFT